MALRQIQEVISNFAFLTSLFISLKANMSFQIQPKIDLAPQCFQDGTELATALMHSHFSLPYISAVPNCALHSAYSFGLTICKAAFKITHHNREGILSSHSLIHNLSPSLNSFEVVDKLPNLSNLHFSICEMDIPFPIEKIN